MRSVLMRAGAVLALSAALAACGGSPPAPQHRDDDWHSPVQILLKYADKDGRVTRAALEAGLRRDFDAADLNRDGVLEPDEVRKVNDARWAEDQSATSPLVDWNGDGVIDFNEFAATARSLFQQYDRNGDGVLTPDELRPQGPGVQKPGDEQQQNGHGHGRGRGGGGGGPPGGGQSGGDGNPGG